MTKMSPRGDFLKIQSVMADLERLVAEAVAALTAVTDAYAAAQHPPDVHLEPLHAAHRRLKRVCQDHSCTTGPCATGPLRLCSFSRELLVRILQWCPAGSLALCERSCRAMGGDNRTAVQQAAATRAAMCHGCAPT